MVVIRLARGGAKKRPFYRIVVADKRFPRDGRYIACIGYFNPLARDSASETRLELDRDLIEKWIKNGAQMSQKVKSLVTEWDKK